jgi:hypothetical protein
MPDGAHALGEKICPQGGWVGAEATSDVLQFGLNFRRDPQG